MPLPPLLSSRPRAHQLVIVCVLPCLFGAVTGVFLGVSELVYLLLIGPVGIVGGYVAGLEHRNGREGVVRGFFGGLQYGLLILAVHEISGADAKADLPSPAILLAVVTTVAGMLLGFLGGMTRERMERRATASPPPAA